MRLQHSFAGLLSLAQTILATSDSSLASLCTNAYARAALPSNNTILGVAINPSSVSTSAHSNIAVAAADFYPAGVISYCNVTFSYSHSGLNDLVHVSYSLPSPSTFQNRFLATGGGGYAINSGNQTTSGGVLYGAAAGITDGGFGSFSANFDTVALLANGTVNWPGVYMFGYQAIHEMTLLGQALTRNFYNASKIYTYYQACSEGGREGLSQVQRFAGVYDGVIVGAPAIRYSFQQAQHLYSNLVEYTLDYYPPPCELEKILNETIAFCDPLDGKTDGVVARSDLCKLHFNVSSTVGKAYNCPATTGGGMNFRKRQGPPGGGGTATPAQNGTVSAKGAQVAAQILKGLHDLNGRQVYLSYQYGASFDDAATAYNSTSKQWTLDITSLGGEWVAKFLQLHDVDNLPNFNGWTYNTLRDYMIQGLNMYSDSLQTTWPDLSKFEAAGGKVLHFHGESDPSIPTGSSVIYHEAVRRVMYPNKSFNDSTAALNKWNKLYLVPGAAHCAPNSLQENGPFPQTNLAVMINWVEKGVEPVTLNATVLQGSHKGENRQICAWPLRPTWVKNGTVMECVYDQASINTWSYDFSGVPLPIY